MRVLQEPLIYAVNRDSLCYEQSSEMEDYLYECGYVKENGILVSQSEMVGFEKSAAQVA